LLELGRLNAARGALTDVRARMETRPDWFRVARSPSVGDQDRLADGRFEKALVNWACCSAR
jgi:hypothetical protein